MGRPALPPERRKDRHVATYLNEVDLAKLTELRAALEDAGAAEVIRQAIRHFHAALVAGKATP